MESPAARLQEEAESSEASPQQIIFESAAKDWTPLMNDFDRRLEAMEKKISDQKPVNDSRKFHLFLLFRAQFSDN